VHTLPRSIYMSPSSATLLGFVGHIWKPPQLRTLMERFRAGALAWAVPFVAVRPAPRSPRRRLNRHNHNVLQAHV
jgi:hypothetical protein